MGVVHFLFIFYADTIQILCRSIFGKHVFFFNSNDLFFFWYRFWTTITAIGSVNVTWWTLEIMPGSSTTPTPMEKEDSR